MGPERKAELGATKPDEKSAQELESLLLTSKRLSEEMQALAMKAQKLAEEQTALAKKHADLIAQSRHNRESRADRAPAIVLVKRALDVAETRLGIQELSKRLNAPDSIVRAWRDGVAIMSKPTFFLLVDVLTELYPNLKDLDETR